MDHYGLPELHKLPVCPPPLSAGCKARISVRTAYSIVSQRDYQNPRVSIAIRSSNLSSAPLSFNSFFLSVLLRTVTSSSSSSSYLFSLRVIGLGGRAIKAHTTAFLVTKMQFKSYSMREGYPKVKCLDPFPDQEEVKPH